MTHRSDERRRALYPKSKEKQSIAEREIQRLTSMLADCYRATGADPEGDEDWRLAEMAVHEVRRLRSESDAEQPKFGRSPVTAPRIDTDEGAEEFALRRALWVNHGCPIDSLCGDDGEMQCNAPDCRHDFKREPLAALCFTLMARGRLHAGIVEPKPPRHTAEQLAEQRADCMSMQAFLRRKGAATNNLRDATIYAEIAAVIDAYLEALEQIHGGGR